MTMTTSRKIIKHDKDGNNTYVEWSDGSWYKQEYDENGNQTYREDSDGSWSVISAKIFRH